MNRKKKEEEIKQTKEQVLKEIKEKFNGSVRDYLLSKGEFKDVPIDEKHQEPVKPISKPRLTPLDSWRLGNKWKAIASISWSLLVMFSKIVVMLFILISCVVFWENSAINSFNTGINIFKQVGMMLLIVFITLVILVIDWIGNLTYRSEIKQ